MFGILAIQGDRHGMLGQVYSSVESCKRGIEFITADALEMSYVLFCVAI